MPPWKRCRIRAGDRGAGEEDRHGPQAHGHDGHGHAGTQGRDPTSITVRAVARRSNR